MHEVTFLEHVARLKFSVMTIDPSDGPNSQHKSAPFGCDYMDQQLHDGPVITHLISEAIISLESDAMAQSKKPGMALGVYQQLWELHAGFEQVRRALRDLRRHRAFQAREIGRLGAWLEEARAATASYLTGAMEEAETNEAGRLFKNRIARERKEE